MSEKKRTIPTELIENQKIYTEHYDVEYTKGLIEKVFKPIDTIWFRSELIGWEEIPSKNRPDTPIIYATNHSGMAFPWDAMIFGYKHSEITNFNEDSIRPLTAPMLSQSALMNPFTIPGFWKKNGAIDATFDNFETMMFYEKQNILIYPEGVPGLGKGFNNRYKLQELKTSFLRMSVKYKTDIIPFFCINGEYLNPYSYDSKAVTRFVNKIGIPFLPLGIITPLILFQPWIFYFAFPANLKFVLGKRIKPYEMVDKEYEDITQEEFKDLSKKIRADWQSQLSDGVKKYGKKPFDLWGLLKKAFTNFKLLPFAFPTAWALAIYEYDRLYKKHGNTDFDLKLGFFRNFLIMLRQPFLFFYFIPIIGLIPIAIKGYRGNKLNKNKKKKKK